MDLKFNYGMKRKLKIGGYVLLAIFLCIFIFKQGKYFNLNPNREVGTVLDRLDGVEVYYNGGVGQSHGRNISQDGYNLGVKYQCVEFVKRYYFMRFQHKMPDAYGNAKDFFDASVDDGEMNAKRGLLQFKNGGKGKPQKGDLLIWKGSFWNPYGHVAIISEVNAQNLTIVQQNAGPFGNSQEKIGLNNENGNWEIEESAILGWLRMP